MITLPGSSRASDLSSVDSVTASGPYTVVIHLKTRFTPLTAVLADVDGVVLSPTQLAKLGDDFGDRIRSASARSCSTTASSATTSP